MKVKVGDLFAPFWVLKFFESRVSLKADKVLFKKLSQSTGEANRVLSEGVGTIGSVAEASGSTTVNGQNLTREQRQEIFTLTNLQAIKSDMTVTMKGGIAKIELNLTPTFEEGLKILDNRIFQGETVVVAEWGYINNDGSVISSGDYVFLCARPNMTFSEQEIAISLSGKDAMTYSSMRGQRTKSWDRTQYTSDQAILDQIAANHGYKLNYDLGITSDFTSKNAKEGDKKSKIVHLLRETKKEPKVKKQAKSDWQFFQELLRENNCLSTPGNGKVINIYDRTKALSVLGVSYNLLIYRNTSDTELGQYDVPIMTFSTQLQGNLFNPVISKEVRYRAPSKNKGKVITKTYDQSKDTNKSKTKGKQGAGAAADGGGADLTGPDNDDRKAEQARQLSVDGSDRVSINAEVTMPGVVGLTPQQLVCVKGLGKSLDGLYRVLTVTHTIGGGGYDTKATILRSVLSQEQIIGLQGATGTNVVEVRKCISPPSLKTENLEGSNVK